ncbi:hypothetical protein R6Q59_009673 [Mikania micrantha]
MSAKARSLTNLLNSATVYSDRTAKNFARTIVTGTGPLASTTDEVILKNYIQLSNDAIDSSSSSSSHLKPSKTQTSSSSKLISELTVESISVGTSSIVDSKRDLRKQLRSVLCGDADVLPQSEENYDNQPLNILDFKWHPTISNSAAQLKRREVSRDRKQTWIFKSTQSTRFGKLSRMCAKKLGTNATLDFFSQMVRETGVKEFNSMIEVCIEKARNTDDEDVALEEFHIAYRIFETMRERGFEIGEVTYGPFLMFIIDMGMVEEFHFFCDIIKKENPISLSRLAYYEMLLWIKVGDEGQIQKLIGNTHDIDDYNFIESYLVALCEADRHKEVSILLETISIKKVSSKENMEWIFISLGKLLLESDAKRFIQELKTEDNGGPDLSNLIYNYAISMPKIQAEDVVEKFKNLHAQLEVAPTSGSLEKLIKICCDSLEVHLAIDLVDSMLEGGLKVKITTVNSVLTACLTSCEYTLVRRISSMINDQESIKPNAETFRIMIGMCVKMKDFDRAYNMIKDLEKLNLLPSSSMYNAIMGGYFRQKNFHKGLMVLKQMDATNVKPDSQTFSYIIGNCNNEDDIIKYQRDLHEAGVKPTKHIFMALINAYAACGLFEKAKQVLSDKGIPVTSLNEIKSVLISALAANGQLADALNVYDEIKQADSNLEPKAAISLIEHLQSEGELSRLLQLLNQLQESELWDDGCARIILYCIRHKLSDSAVDLLKQRMEKSSTNEMVIDVLFDEVFCQIAETEPTDVQFGLDLLQALKDDIGIRPSRKSLDFLLSACVNAKDLKRSFLVWNEYKTAGLPYNVLSYVRMYQALLASGAHKAAKVILENIPDDDPQVCGVLKACQETFGKTTSRGKKKKKKFRGSL